MTTSLYECFDCHHVWEWSDLEAYHRLEYDGKETVLPCPECGSSETKHLPELQFPLGEAVP